MIDLSTCPIHRAIRGNARQRRTEIRQRLRGPFICMCAAIHAEEIRSAAKMKNSLDRMRSAARTAIRRLRPVTVNCNDVATAILACLSGMLTTSGGIFGW